MQGWSNYSCYTILMDVLPACSWSILVRVAIEALVESWEMTTVYLG